MTKILSNKSNIDLDYPICRPSLDLDFTQEVLDPRITFSRGSIGTRVNRNRLIETVSANQPRFDYDPVTGECKGLLIEESRTNINTRGDIEGTVGAAPTAMNFAGATGQTAVVSTDVSLGPNGQSAKHTRGTSSDNNVGYFNWGSHTLNLPYTASVYVYIPSSQAKNFSGKYITFQVEAVGASGAVSADVNIIDRWQRVSLTYTPTSATNVPFVARTNAVTGSFFYTDCWQEEQGSAPTSYMPASGGSQFTRSADNASMTGTNFSSWYNQSEGTVYTKANSNNLANGGTIFIASNASYTERYAQLGLTGNVGYGYGATWFTNSSIIGGGAFTLVGDTYANGAYKKIAVSGIAGNFNGVSGNQILSSKKTNLYPSGITQARIGSYNNNVSYLNGTISRLTYYPRALKPNQLQYLTQ